MTTEINLESPVADRCIFRESTNNGTKHSSSRTTRVCGFREVSPIAPRYRRQHSWRVTFLLSSQQISWVPIVSADPSTRDKSTILTLSQHVPAEVSSVIRTRETLS